MSEKKPRSRRIRTWVWRATKWAGALFLVACTVAIVDGWRAFGSGAAGARRDRVRRSPQWRDGSFVNPQPIVNDSRGAIALLFKSNPAIVSPTAPPPSVSGDRTRFQSPPLSGVRVTWLGHSSTLIEIDGHRVLTDPVWSDRASPLSWIGPRRWFAPPIALDQLPPIDAVVISHDHYDHLDYRTIAAMKEWSSTFVVPLGVGAHLAYWGIPESRIVELDWWERTKVRDLEIVCTPSRHASGRTLIDNNGTLWASYALVGGQHRVYYSGDTGLFPGLRDIGARLGPFDVTLIEIGQYDRAWPDWHLGPEQAVRAHQMVGGRIFFPIHWGLFALAFHGWTEPIERAIVAAQKAGVPMVAPRPGQSIEPLLPVSAHTLELAERAVIADIERTGEAEAGRIERVGKIRALDALDGAQRVVPIEASPVAVPVAILTVTAPVVK